MKRTTWQASQLLRQMPQRIGSGAPAVVRSQTRSEWPEMVLHYARESIRRPTDWEIREDRNVIIVHLGGEMKELETQLDGRCGSVGPATPGEIWSIPSGRDYASYALGGEIEFAVLYLTSSTQSDGVEIELLSGVRDDALYKMVRRLVRRSGEDSDTAQMESETLVESISSHIYSQHLVAGSAKHEIPAKQLNSLQARMIREYVWENLTERLTVSGISTLLDMTPHDLLTAFREVFNTTPAQYVIAQRLRRAQWLLLYTDWEITRIALESGFSSHSHLTSTFKSRLGYPPSRFRAQLKY